MGRFDLYLEKVKGVTQCAVPKCQHKFKEQKNSGTSLFHYHFLNKHPEIATLLGLQKDKEKKVEKRKADESADIPVVSKKPTLSLADSFNKWAPNSPHVRAMDRALLQWILMDDRPFSMMESEGFKLFMKAAVPQFKPKSRPTYMKLMDELYEEYKEKIRAELKEADWVSIGSDLWCSKNNQHQLIVITGHFLLKGKLVTRILHCEPFDERHTAENIEKKIRSMLEDMEITDKVVGFVREGASNIKKAGKLLDIEHFDCFAHKIQNAIMHGLSALSSCTNVVAKVKRIVKKIGRSAIDNEELKELQNDNDLPDLALVKSTEVRWSSLYKMCDRFLKLRTAIELFLAGNPQYPRLSSSEWTMISKLQLLLKPLHDGSIRVQGRHETASVILPLCKLYLTILSADTILEEVSIRIKEKLEEKYEEYKNSELLILSTILDPRFKAKYCPDGAKELLLREAKKAVPREEKSTTEKRRDNPDDEDPFAIFDESDDSLDQNQSLAIIDQTKIIEAEVDKYLSIPADRKIDNFQYWNDETTRAAYPYLTDIALKCLTCPASSAESERAFSGAGRIASALRRCITPTHLAKASFLQQNIKFCGPN